jgi:hypothetical protein
MRPCAGRWISVECIEELERGVSMPAAAATGMDLVL